VVLDPAGTVVELRFGHGTTPTRIDIVSGAIVPDGGAKNFFAVLHDLHEHLLLGAKPVVEYSAWAMVLLILAGPFLAWPRLSNTVTGWHAGIGWILLPLVLLPAGTIALRTLGIGHPQLIEPTRSSPPVTWASAIARTAAADGLARIEAARRLPGGGVAVITGQGPDTRIWIVTGQGVTVTDAGRNWMKDLHDGIWGGTVVRLAEPGIGYRDARPARYRRCELGAPPACGATTQRRCGRRDTDCACQPDRHRHPVCRGDGLTPVSTRRCCAGP
jgi:sulfite reductase (NADPH) flavoprotein alpha-component